MPDKPKTLPLAVREALHKRFGAEATAILARIQWDSLNGCYWFTWKGMYVGVETDGYVHT